MKLNVLNFRTRCHRDLRPIICLHRHIVLKSSRKTMKLGYRFISMIVCMQKSKKVFAIFFISGKGRWHK